jgi:hypothetical protein
MTQPSSDAAPGAAAHFTDLLRALEGLRNPRAVLLLVAFTAAGLGVAACGIALANVFLSPVFILAGVGVMFWGYSAAGLALMDQARGLPPRPLLLAVTDGLSAFLRGVAVALIGLLGVVVFYVLMALILLLCKIPGVGPVLYAVVFPVLVIMGGLLFFSIFTALSMIGPSIWNGAGIRGAVAMLWQIVTRRAVELLVNLLLLALLLWLAAGIIAAFVFTGVSSVSALSVPLLGSGGNLFGLGGFSFGGSAYPAAAFIGGGILFILVSAALNAMTLMGCNLIYLKLSAGLDPGETERLIGQRLEEARQKAQELKEEARKKAQELKDKQKS